MSSAARRHKAHCLGACLYDAEPVTALETEHDEEVRQSGLIEHLEQRAAEFWDTVQGETERGHRYNTGRVTGRDGYDEGLRLYRLLRELKPVVAVETGVCNGVSTAFLLLALERNGDGAVPGAHLEREDDVARGRWRGRGRSAGAVATRGRGFAIAAARARHAPMIAQPVRAAGRERREG